MPVAVITVCGQRLALNLLEADGAQNEHINYNKDTYKGDRDVDDDVETSRNRNRNPLHSRVLSLGGHVEDGKNSNSYTRGPGWVLQRAA